MEKDVNSVQIGGSHYKELRIQPWDFCIANSLGFLRGNIVRYVCRYKNKNGVEDLEKAKHYILKLVETLENPDPQETITASMFASANSLSHDQLKVIKSLLSPEPDTSLLLDAHDLLTDMIKRHR